LAGSDHIAALTVGLTLPLSPIAPAHMAVILEALAKTWAEMMSSNSATCSDGDEKAVNALLEPRLNSRFQTDPDYLNLVSSVVRGKETVNFNGAALEKRPDLSLMFAAPRHNFPLVIECKIIDHPDDKTTRLYCNEGLIRFVNGEYAWATKEAIMLAYVRDGSTVEGRLVAHLTTAAGKSPDPFQSVAYPTSDIDVHPTAHRSEHGRTFSYPAEVDGGDPGPIRLWHLWLSLT
jgi:hypothetical protein